VRIHRIAVSLMRFDVFVTSDVMTSPDFGLAVLGLCGPKIAFYPKCLQCFCSGEGAPSDDEEGKPPIILTLLPFPLFIAQWGLLWSVFTQSVQDCKCCDSIRVLYFFCPHACLIQGKTQILRCSFVFFTILLTPVYHAEQFLLHSFVSSSPSKTKIPKVPL
jgi:hypothetical protein